MCLGLWIFRIVVQNILLYPINFEKVIKKIIVYIRHLSNSSLSDILNILLHPPSWTFFFIRHLEHSSSSAILNILLHPPSWTHPTPWTFSFIRHLEHSLTSDILNILLHPTSWTTKCVLSLEQWTFTSEHHDSILMLILFFSSFFPFHFCAFFTYCSKVSESFISYGEVRFGHSLYTLYSLTSIVVHVLCTMYNVHSVLCMSLLQIFLLKMCSSSVRQNSK